MFRSILLNGCITHKISNRWKNFKFISCCYSQKLAGLRKFSIQKSLNSNVAKDDNDLNKNSNKTEQNLVGKNTSKNKIDENDELIDKKFNSIEQATSDSKRQIKNEPFIKNLFCGKYIYDYLKYPEYDNNQVLNELNSKYVQPVRKYLESTKLDQIINESGNFSIDAFKNFKSLGFYSQSLPKCFGGNNLDATGVTRIIEQSSIYPSIGINLIYNNELASKAILLYGNQEQKQKYLNRISTGELKAGFCYSELDNGVDQLRFNLSARRLDNNENEKEASYVLNGKKAWVCLLTNDDDISNKENDVVFVIICKSIQPFKDNKEEEEVKLNAFLVEKSTPGLSLRKQLTNYNGLNLYEVELNDVKVTSKNLLGTDGSGYEISTKLIESSRFYIGAICIGILKDLFKKTVEYTIKSRRFERSLSEFQIVKDRICDIETKLYTMESMTYMTAGILDSYEIADIGCEAALTKIYCTETLKTCVDSCLQILAMGAYTKLDEVQNRYLTELNFLSNMFNTNDFLRLYVATNGIVLAGIEFSDSLIKLRNPFLNPGYVLKKMIANYRLLRSVNKKAPEYLYLWEHLHPSLAEPASILEQSAVKFMMTIKYSLISHGREIVDYQYSMKHLTNIAMHLYALNSTLARASRSYSIGLNLASHELGLANIQAKDSSLAINQHFDEIVKSRQGRGLENVKTNIADNVFKCKQHAATHSLTRNY